VTIEATAVLASTLRLGTPLIFAAMGGLVSERSGIVNIGLEGLLLTGAFFAVVGSYFSGSAWVGVGVAVLAGSVLAAVHAVMCIRFGANQIISGTAINLVALGGTSYLLLQTFGVPGSSPQVHGFGDSPVPGLASIPVVGPALFGQTWFVWAAPLCAVALWALLGRTRLGLRIRASGEDPKALEAAGVRVLPLRYAAVTASGALCGVGGAHLSLGLLTAFSENMTTGRGFIALAAVIMGGWRPLRAMSAALLFGFFEALVIRLPQELVAPQFLQMVPYVATIAVMVLFARGSLAPAGAGQDYRARSGR